MSLHKKISFIKSTVRMLGYFAGILGAGLNVVMFYAFVILMISEVIGIVEEIGEN